MNKQCGFAFVPFLLANWKVLAIGALVIAALVGGKLFLKGVENKGYERGKTEVQVRFDKFVNDTKAAGFKAEAAAIATNIHNKAREERANEENKVLRNNLAAERSRLRNLRAGAGGSVLPGASAGATSAESISFNRALLDGALREFTEAVEGLVGEGAEAIIDLDTAKRWAK